MKKRLLPIFLMAFVAFTAQAGVGDDLTSRFLQNADFSADEPVRAGICTYDYDMSKNGTSLYGQQVVTGWIASNPTDNELVADRTDGRNARAAGIFELGKQYVSDYTGNDDDFTPIFLGGTSYLTPTPESGIQDGKVLGLLAVWGANVQYTQEVTLPAGAYSIEVPVYNGGGDGTVGANKFGFIAGDQSFVSEMTTWPVNEWTTMTINFQVKEETTGVISLGYTASGAGSGSMPKLYIPYVKVLEGDKAALDKAEVDKLKETLLEVLEISEELSVNIDAELAVYEDENATLDQVQAAIDSLKEKNANAMTDFTDYFINNAHFSLGTPLDNGVCTYAKDKEVNATTYAGMQPVECWTSSDGKTDVDGKAAGLFPVGGGEQTWLGGKNQGFVPPTQKANGATDGNVFGFVACWSAQANYTQNVTLPAGSYTITIPTYNSKGGTQAIDKNLCGFIADDGTEYLATTTVFAVDEWKNETIKFKLEEETSGVISIGYKAANAGSGNMPHLFIDEFTLMFNGLTSMDPSLIALNGAIRNGESYVDADAFCEAALKAALEEAIEKGTELKEAGSSDAEANVAATTAINDAITALKASVATYAKFAEFIGGKLANTIEKYTGTELEEFAGQLSDALDTYTYGMEDGEYTTEQINEIMNGFDATVVAAVQDALALAAQDTEAHNIDITCLFADKNLDYANNNVNGWQNETGTDKYLSRVQTAEVWGQNAFYVSQTLNNLPAGVYEISVPGFYRAAANDVNYDQYNGGSVNGKAYLVAGGNSTLLKNVATLVSSEQDDQHDGTIVDGETYVPNSNNAAHWFFYDQEDKSNVMNSVRAALAEAGDLTIGVRGVDLEGDNWVVWGAFNVVFKGYDGMESALYSELQAKVAEAGEVAGDASIVVAADSQINDAMAKAEECTEESSVEELTDAIKSLNAAIAYGKESVVLVEKLGNELSVYTEALMGQVESDEPTFVALTEEIYGCLSDGFESNDQINGFIAGLQNGWARYVQYPVLNSASIEVPADITAAILNAGFEGITHDQTIASGEGNGDYWTKERDGGNDFGYEAGVYENYNSNTFSISQTIKGLEPGFYTVKVQGFYRAGSNQDNANAFVGDSLTSTVQFFANGAVKNLNNQMENGSNGEAAGEGAEVAITVGDNAEYFVPNDRTACAALFSIGLYDNSINCEVGEDGVLTIGLKKETHVGGDWTPFDNFRLYYLGKNAPDAIENITGNATGSVRATSIYNVNGQLSGRLQKGVNIIKQTLSDGQVRVTKVLVK